MSTFDSVAIFKILDSSILSQFLHECVDDLIGKRSPNFENYNNDIEWTLEDYTTARKNVQNLFKNAVITDNFELKDDKLKPIGDCFEIRKNEIFQYLIKESLVASGRNLVTNFDWKIKWVMGSSKLSSLKEALLQVDLFCMTNEGRKCVNFEVNLEQLDQLIEVLNLVKEEGNKVD